MAPMIYSGRGGLSSVDQANSQESRFTKQIFISVQRTTRRSGSAAPANAALSECQLARQSTKKFAERLLVLEMCVLSMPWIHSMWSTHLRPIGFKCEHFRPLLQSRENVCFPLRPLSVRRYSLRKSFSGNYRSRDVTHPPVTKRPSPARCHRGS